MVQNDHDHVILAGTEPADPNDVGPDLPGYPRHVIPDATDHVILDAADHVVLLVAVDH